MTNQEAYDELCDKAEKYDKLVKAIGNIKTDIIELGEKYDLDNLGTVCDIIDKHTKEVIK